MKKLEKSLFEVIIKPNLNENDDFELWLQFLNVFNENLDLYEVGKKYEIFLQIGMCSHWLRPHQTRLTVAGGFAYPAGYNNTTNYGYGLPEFDWSEIFHFDKTRNKWINSESFTGKQKLVCRVAIPNRTQQHDQAAIHLFWSPGSPENAKEKLRILCGFRKIDENWECVTTTKI